VKAIHVIKGKGGIAGAERHLLDLLPGLRAAGLDVALVVLEETGASGKTLVSAVRDRGIAVERLTLDGAASARAFFRLVRLFRRERPDLVHTHLPHADIHAIPAARAAGVRTIVSTQHNEDPRRRGLIQRSVARALYRRVDRVIAVSESVKRFVIEVDRLPGDRIEVIPHGVAARRTLDRGDARRRLSESFGIPETAPLIGGAGRLIDAKGFDDLLRAFDTVRERHPLVHLAIAGDGPLRAVLEAKAWERVHFLGWMADVHPFFAALDVFAVPSMREGFGLVALEAMPYETALVVTNAGALPELVTDGDTGLVVPAGDPASLARALVRLLEDEPLRTRLGRSGRLRAEARFTIDRMVSATVAVYHRVLESAVRSIHPRDAGG
jgi:glycosyltransferase involved in cell wall biosynthesis